MIDTSLPLTDLHRHLDGNIRPQTILDLGREFGVALPANTLDALRPHVQVTATEQDLVSFLQKLDLGVSVLARWKPVSAWRGKTSPMRWRPVWITPSCVFHPITWR